jgi:hypothetical protein
LHPQWPAQCPKMGQKKGLRPLGVNIYMAVNSINSPVWRL